jgi:hypothetical protein
MPYVTLSDVWIPSVFASYQINDSVESTAFIESGIAVTNALFNDLANGPGRITTMPFWNDLDASLEPNYSNDVYTDIAQPQGLSTGEMLARIADLNEGWGTADLVQSLNGTDPLKLVAQQVDAYWARQFQRRCLASAIGIYNDNVAGNASDMTIDISDTAMAVDAANLISSTAVINAALTMGDQLNKVGAIAMHSVVYGNLLKQDLITFVPTSEQDVTIPTYLGKRVVVDDGMPIVGGNGSTVAYKYLTILFAPGAFGYGKGNAKVPQEFQRDPERGNGGGFETLWIRKRWVVHPAGYSFTSATVTGPGLSPTWADLKLATNWTRVYPRKTVGMAFIVSNG